MENRRSFADILAGAIFIAIGLAFVVGSLGYELGTLLRMGPGYFPLATGGILTVLGLVILVKGLVAGEIIEFGSIPWRSVILVVAAILFFGLTIRRLGFVPSVAVTALLTALASYRIRLLTAVAVAAGITVLSVLIFVVALQLPLPLYGDWFPF